MNRPIPTPGAAPGTTSTHDAEDWRDRAACLGHDAELFHAADEERADRRKPRVAKAQAICAMCPVRQACLDWALKHRIREGIWGGLDEDARHSLLRRIHDDQANAAADRRAG